MSSSSMGNMESAFIVIDSKSGPTSGISSLIETAIKKREDHHSAIESFDSKRHKGRRNQVEQNRAGTRRKNQSPKMDIGTTQRNRMQRSRGTHRPAAASRRWTRRSTGTGCENRAPSASDPAPAANRRKKTVIVAFF